MPEVYITCNECDEKWVVEGSEMGYKRSDLVAIAPSMARHARYVHGNEETALRLERWAITPPPKPYTEI